MEKLTRLTASGFRSIREIDMELGDLTVLVGANGSGKSNFVAFFNLLSFMVTGSLQLCIGRKGGGSSLLHYGPKRTPVLTTTLRFEGDNRWSEYGCTLAHASPDRLIFTHEQVAFQRRGEEKPFCKVLGSGQAETDLAVVSTGSDRVAAQVSQVFLSRLKGLRVYHLAGQGDGLAGSNPRNDRCDGRTLVGEQFAFVPVEQRIVVGLRLQALTFDRVDPQLTMVLVANANTQAAVGQGLL